MIKITDFEVVGMKWALLAMREPYESMERSDSVGGPPFSGKEDMKLACKLIKGGGEHRKFMRFPEVYARIIGPRYWWTEFDTYRAGVEKSSSSTIHLLMKRPITVMDFSTGDDKLVESAIQPAINLINMNVEMSKATKSREIKNSLLVQAKRALPDSFFQERILKISYEALLAMIHQRQYHTLSEWQDFCDWALTLPNMSEFMRGLKNDES